MFLRVSVACGRACDGRGHAGGGAGTRCAVAILGTWADGLDSGYFAAVVHSVAL